MRTFNVPAGIGDVSWAYSKLGSIKADWVVSNGWPARTAPFLELLPNVNTSTYGEFQYSTIVAFEEAVGFGPSPKWERIQSIENLYIEPNRHLEAGKRLEDWLPDLPVNYHYDINIPEEDLLRARNRISHFPRPLTGISAASYRGSEAWKTWGYKEWSPFLKWLHAQVGGTILLMGGFWDDLTDTLSDDGWPSLVGRTSVPTAMQLLKELDYYVGFSSGLGIVRTVMRKNAFMLWPDHQLELSTSWSPPDMLEVGTYIAQPWRDVEIVQKRVSNWLKNCESLRREK